MRAIRRIIVWSLLVLSVAVLAPWVVSADTGSGGGSSSPAAEPEEVGPQSLEEARKLLEAGDYSSAISMLEALVQNQIELLYLLGTAYIDTGQASNAVSVLQKARALDPYDYDVSLELGRALIDDGQYWDAVDILRELKQSYPDDMAVLRELATALTENGDYQEAHTIYDRLIKAEPGNSHFQNELGILYFRQGDYAKAASQFETAARISPEDPVLHRNIGDSYFNMEKWLAAISAYSKALDLDPEDILALVNSGRAYAEANRLNDAEAALLEATEVDPNHAPAHYNLGLVLLKTGDPDDVDRAVESFLRAADLAPKEAAYSRALAEIYFEYEMYQEALTWYISAFESSGEYSDRFKVAESAARLGIPILADNQLFQLLNDLEDAEDWSDYGVSHEAFLSLLADVRMAIGRYLSAEELLNMLIEQYPDSPDIDSYKKRLEEAGKAAPLSQP